MSLGQKLQVGSRLFCCSSAAADETKGTFSVSSPESVVAAGIHSDCERIIYSFLLLKAISQRRVRVCGIFILIYQFFGNLICWFVFGGGEQRGTSADRSGSG